MKINRMTTEKKIKCTNCDFYVDAGKKPFCLQDIKKWVYKPCPKCGELFFNEKDYDLFKYDVLMGALSGIHNIVKKMGKI
jgi:hypothetical protein